MGVQETAEAPAQDVPASTSAEEVVDQQQPTEQESTETETGKNEVDIPKDNAAWAKMRVENARLKEVINQVDPEYLEKLQTALRPQEYPNQPVQQLPEDADYSQVTQELNQLKLQAARSQQENARMRNLIELQQDKQAEEAFPDLKTDKVFQQQVAEKKLVARVLGQEKTTLEIAREVDNLLRKRDEQTAVKVVQATKQQMVEAQAAMAEPQSTTSNGRSAVEDETLRHGMRKGDMNATTEVAKGLIADLEF